MILRFIWLGQAPPDGESDSGLVAVYPFGGASGQIVFTAGLTATNNLFGTDITGANRLAGGGIYGDGDADFDIENNVFADGITQVSYGQNFRQLHWNRTGREPCRWEIKEPGLRL